MRGVFGNDALWIGKGELRHCEGHSVLPLVLLVLAWIPFEPCLRHEQRLAWVWLQSHTRIWLPRTGRLSRRRLAAQQVPQPLADDDKYAVAVAAEGAHKAPKLVVLLQRFSARTTRVLGKDGRALLVLDVARLEAMVEEVRSSA